MFTSIVIWECCGQQTLLHIHESKGIMKIRKHNKVTKNTYKKAKLYMHFILFSHNFEQSFIWTTKMRYHIFVFYINVLWSSKNQNMQKEKQINTPTTICCFHSWPKDGTESVLLHKCSQGLWTYYYIRS